MTAPVIAVNGLYHAEDPMLRLRQRYPDAVRRAGGMPVALAPRIDPAGREDELAAVLERVDGLVLTGGDDFVTEDLGLGPTHPAADATDGGKQCYDLALTRMALDMDLPVLGICYGMQCLGLAGGATLWQDLPDQRPGEIAHADSAVHGVRAHGGTKLGRIVGLDPVPVVSRHHQALRSVPPPWIVSGVDDEGLVEAIEHPERSFAIGIQWHPELSPGETVHEALFLALTEAARTRSKNRRP